MYSFYIDNDDIKVFMNKLLIDDSFYSFELRSCEVKKDITFSIDGLINKNWYDEEIITDFINWSNVQPYIFNIIKGKKVPSYIKIVLGLNTNAVEKIHSNAKACFLNILFEDGKAGIVTGTAQKEFTLDKSVDAAWEDNVKKFFRKLQIRTIE